MRTYISFAALVAGTSALVPRNAKTIPSEAYVEVQSIGVTWPYRVFKTSSHTPPNMTITTNGQPLTYNGKQYLTYWNGYNSQGLNVGHGYGQTNFLDDTYQHFAVNPGLGLNKLVNTSNPDWSTDIHEHQMTDRNTLLVSAYNNTPYDLTSVGGSADGWIVDGLIFEIDIATQEVLFSWHALDHLPLNASHQPLGTAGNQADPWDWFVCEDVIEIPRIVC